MLSDQGSRGVAERNASMHGVSREQAAGQSPLAERVEPACELFEVDRNAFLVPVGAGSSNRKNPERLRSPIERRNQMPVDLVGREALCLVCPKKSICDEYGAFADGSVCDQTGIDPHRDVQTDVLGVVEHEVAKVAAICRRRWDGPALFLGRGVGENLVRRVEAAVLCIGEQALAARTEQARGHGTHLLASTQVF